MPELLDGTNHVPWFKAGATIFSDKGIQYLGVPGLINARSIVATLLVQVPAFSHDPSCPSPMIHHVHDPC